MFLCVAEMALTQDAAEKHAKGCWTRSENLLGKNLLLSKILTEQPDYWATTYWARYSAQGEQQPTGQQPTGQDTD